MPVPRPEAEIFSNLDHWPRTIGQFRKIGAGHLAPISSAVRDWRCRFAVIPQGAQPFAFAGKEPIIGLVTDGMNWGLGPTGFDAPSIERFISTCRAVAILVAPEDAPYLAAACIATILRRNSAVIETCPRQETAWMELIQRAAPAAQIIVSKSRVN